ncbi:MAG: glycosyltransferase family 39 protein [Myxococcota bacterium]
MQRFGSAVGLLAVLLAVHALNRWPLYAPELFTWSIAGDSLIGALTGIAGDKHPPLHTLLVWGLRRISDAEWMSRLPSAIGGVLAAGGLIFAARREVETPWALLGGLILILSPMWINYVGVARPYALMMACSAGLMASALEIRDDPRRGFIGLTTFCIVGMYLHYVMVVPIGAVLMGVLAGAMRPGRQAVVLKGLTACVGATGLALLPWMAWASGAQLSRSIWAMPSVRVYRYLAFDVDEFVSFGMLAVVLAAAVGALTAAQQRRWELLGFSAGVVILPYLFSVNVELQNREYALIGMLPLVVLLAVVGLQRMFRRPASAALAVGVLLGPEAWLIAALPSAPYGKHDAGFDNGYHDARRDMALLSSLTPPGARLLLPDIQGASIFAHYAPDAARLTDGMAPRPADWALLGCGPRCREPGPDEPGCLLRAAFTLPLRLPDDRSCERVLTALAKEEHPPWLLERATQADDPASAQDLLQRARAGSSALPELPLAKSLVEGGRLEEADAVISAGVWEALRWKQLRVASGLMRARSQIASLRGDQAAATAAEAKSRCLREAPADLWMPHRCMWSVTAVTVPSRARSRRPPRQKNPGAPGKGKRTSRGFPE